MLQVFFSGSTPDTGSYEPDARANTAMLNTQKVTEVPNMPLFTSDDYANLHPERDHVPSGMLDESFMIDFFVMYTHWFADVIERWPDSADKLSFAFGEATPLWSRVALRRESDDPQLMLLLTTATSAMELLDCIHPETREDVISHLSEIAKIRRGECESAGERAEVDAVFTAMYRFARSTSDDARVEFLMQMMDLGHDDDGQVDRDKAVRVSASLVVASIAIVVAIPDLETRETFIKVLRVHTEAIAADPAVPYYDSDDD